MPAQGARSEAEHQTRARRRLSETPEKEKLGNLCSVATILTSPMGLPDLDDGLLTRVRAIPGRPTKSRLGV